MTKIINNETNSELIINKGNPTDLYIDSVDNGKEKEKEKEEDVISTVTNLIIDQLGIDIDDIDDIEEIDGRYIVTLNDFKLYECITETLEVLPYVKPKQKKIKLTDEEKNQIAEDNIALVHYVLKGLHNTHVSYDELFSAGMVGYAKALDSFNKANGAKFSTYAINCIRNEVLFFLRKENKYNQNTTSLNKILSVDKNGNNLQLEEIMSDEQMGEKSLEDLILDDENKEVLLKALKYLKEEERFILIYRFGLDRGIIKTQKEIADEINMSQANVSKIQKNCLQKLRLILRKDV